MNDTPELLRGWVERGSEDAFARLVARHIDLVYSVALRKVAGDTALAADITQTVFADLARKARGLRPEGSLAGWLHRHTCHTAATALRGELRRRVREQTAAAMHALENSDDPNWLQLAPMLDDAVNALGETDRRAILLRFYEQRDLRSVGAVLGVSDDTAQKRVARALEKLRHWLGQRGVTSTSATLAALLGAQSVSAAPAGLAATVTSGALAGTVAGAGITLTILESLMTAMKSKLAATAALAAVVAAPLAWQENAIGKLRNGNLAIAAELEPVGQVEAGVDAALIAADAANDRAELDRLRRETEAAAAQLQQARDARALAAQTVAQARSAAAAARTAAKPGTMLALDARDVGAATGEALMQTFFWASRVGDTGRMAELVEFANPQMREKMLKSLETARDGGRMEREAAQLEVRFVRQVPLEDGDAAVVVEMRRHTPDRATDFQRETMRIRHNGTSWRIVMGENGPEVKLSPEQMQDP